MRFRKALSIILAVCMILSSVSVAYAEEIPEITETSIVEIEENVTEDQTAEVAEAAEVEAEPVEEESEIEDVTAEEAEASEDIVLTAELDDVIVTLNADADAFDNKGELALKVTPVEIAESDEEALDAVETENVAKRVTYDITVLDDGEEIEPVKDVTVSFELKDAPSGADGVNIYHHDEEEGIEKIATEVLKEDAAEETVSVGEAKEETVTEKNVEITEVSEEELADTDDVEIENDVTVEATTDSFSLYTVDFTYKDKTISIAGDTTGNKLDDIVAQLGIEEKVEEATAYQNEECTVEAEDNEVKNTEGETLFSVYESGDNWYVDAENAFQTEHGLVIKTADGAEYKIKVTDAAGDYLKFTAKEDGVKIRLMKEGLTMYPDVSLVYSKDDGTNWYTFTPYGPYDSDTSSNTITLEHTNDSVMIRASGVNNPFSVNNANYYRFTISKKADASGDVTTLLNSSGVSDLSASSYNNCFNFLFEDCSNLQSVQNLKLPATKLSNYCYMHMFNGCTSLTTAPELPATTLAEGCYDSMFYGCTGLTEAPKLPVTTLAEGCYANMFQNCTSLTTAPKLPATTLAELCYSGMFDTCTSLITAPELPAKTLAKLCYQNMFRNCGALIKAPALPATTLTENCYECMFNGCTSLITAPSLPAKTLETGCYNNMFAQCTSLTTAPALPATTLANLCYECMFNGCTSLITAPALPATALTAGCYYEMFANCANLTTAPLLSAETLASQCYEAMFRNCTNLKVYDTNIDDSYALWVTICDSSICDAMLDDVHSISGQVTKYDNHKYYVKIRTITFDVNGHGTAPANQNVASGGKITRPADPTAEGYTFGGWYKEPECTNAWDFDNDIVTADTTLYAKWTQNSTPSPTSSGSSGGSSSYNSGWQPSGINWQYVKSDGSYARNEWLQIELNGEKKWYHFGNDTMMDTGWFLDTDGSWYYLNKENNQYIGTMYTGWLTDPQDGYRYYLDPATGKMHTGWHVVDGKKHYFNETVPSASGWTQDAEGNWVYDKRSVIPLGAMLQ